MSSKNVKGVKLVAVLIAVLVVGLGGFFGGQASVIPQTITETFATTTTMTETKFTTLTETLTTTLPPLTETVTLTQPPTTITATVTAPQATVTVTATPTPAPKGTTVKVGKPLIVRYGFFEKHVFEVLVLDFVRGEEANNEIREASFFNPKPKKGFEYLMVKVQQTYLEGEEAERVYKGNFTAFVEHVGYDYKWLISLPEDKHEFPSVDLLPGGKVDGWIVFEVPSGKEVLIAYMYGDEPLGFISIPS